MTIDPVVDFTGGYQGGRWAALSEDFYCDWRGCWFNQRIEPPSWILGDEVVAAGAKGILFRSRLSPQGVNLLLYVDELGPTDRLEVHDPQRVLPRNQSSWTEKAVPKQTGRCRASRRVVCCFAKAAQHPLDFARVRLFASMAQFGRKRGASDALTGDRVSDGSAEPIGDDPLCEVGDACERET
nr:RES family NAD+ phosphorylase [Paraburkholderia rhynchosiae]